MKKVYLVSAGYYTNFVYPNLKDATAAFEALSNAIVDKEYINGRYVAVEKKGEDATLSMIDLLTREEYDAELKAKQDEIDAKDKAADAKDKAAAEQAAQADNSDTI